LLPDRLRLNIAAPGVWVDAPWRPTSPSASTFECCWYDAAISSEGGSLPGTFTASGSFGGTSFTTELP
jgi:hypothetical protein